MHKIWYNYKKISLLGRIVEKNISAYVKETVTNGGRVDTNEELEVKQKNHIGDYADCYFVYEFVVYYCKQNIKRHDAKV